MSLFKGAAYALPKHAYSDKTASFFRGRSDSSRQGLLAVYVPFRYHRLIACCHATPRRLVVMDDQRGRCPREAISHVLCGKNVAAAPLVAVHAWRSLGEIVERVKNRHPTLDCATSPLAASNAPRLIITSRTRHPPTLFIINLPVTPPMPPDTTDQPPYQLHQSRRWQLQPTPKEPDTMLACVRVWKPQLPRVRTRDTYLGHNALGCGPLSP
jgi:hypothetical protein